MPNVEDSEIDIGGGVCIFELPPSGLLDLHRKITPGDSQETIRDARN